MTKDFKGYPAKANTSHPGGKVGKKDYWPKAWETIANKLSEISWEEFRMHRESITHLEGGRETGRKFWSNLCEESGIPPEDYRDSLIGSPAEARRFEFNGVPVTANSCRFAHYIKLISERLKPTGPIRVLEVGGGYGGLAEQLCRKYTVSKYFFLDHPVLQTLQGYFMIKAGLGSIICFDRPTEIDLIISVGGTLSEMPLETVAEYIRLFEGALKPGSGFMYLAQHKKRQSYVQTVFEDYPFDGKWELETSQNAREAMIDCFGRRPV